MTHQQQISFRTTGHGHMHDLTDQVTTIAAASGIRTGLIHIFTSAARLLLAQLNLNPDFNMIFLKF